MRALQTLLTFSACLISCGKDVVDLYPSLSTDSSIESGDAGRLRAARVDAGRPPAIPLEKPDTGEGLPAIEFSEFPDVAPSALKLDEPVGCQKVDFLFVVDNSRSMRDKQNALVRSFPGFMATVQQTLSVEDVHVMAVDTDGKRLPLLSDETCDDALGAGRPTDADGVSCGIAAGRRFMTSEQPDLPDTFACAATAGASGSLVERPVEAALNAVSDTFNGTGGCNEGFLRPDAILVVMLITDEDDERSDDDPPDWRAQLVDSKGGQEDALVLLALVGPENRFEPSAVCDEAQLDVQAAPRLHEFVGSFEAGFIGDVCADDYAPFFEDAVSTVVGSCNAFMPPIQ